MYSYSYFLRTSIGSMFKSMSYWLSSCAFNPLNLKPYLIYGHAINAILSRAQLDFKQLLIIVLILEINRRDIQYQRGFWDQS